MNEFGVESILWSIVICDTSHWIESVEFIYEWTKSSGGFECCLVLEFCDSSETTFSLILYRENSFPFWKDNRICFKISEISPSVDIFRTLMNTRTLFDNKLLLRSSHSLFSPILTMTSEMIVELFLFRFFVRVYERVDGFMTHRSFDSETHSEFLDSLGDLLWTLVPENSFDYSTAKSSISIEFPDIPFVLLPSKIIPISPRGRVYESVSGHSL